MPFFMTGTMKIDRLLIVATPHHGRVLQELPAMKTPMASSRKAEGVRFKFGDGMGNHVTRLFSCITSVSPPGPKGPWRIGENGGFHR
jgi:hypothetical protein